MCAIALKKTDSYMCTVTVPFIHVPSFPHAKLIGYIISECHHVAEVHYYPSQFEQGNSQEGNLIALSKNVGNVTDLQHSDSAAPWVHNK